MVQAFRGNNLALHEEIVLLALEDRKGTFQWSMAGPVLGAAVFADLVLRGRVEVPDDGRDPLVELLDDEPLGNPVLDEALERIATASRRARLSHWITRFGNRRGLAQEIARELCRRGILREDEKSVLVFFRQKVFPEVNPVPERHLVARLEKAIFADGPVDDRTAVLISLAHTSNVLRFAIAPDRLKKRKKRIEAVAAGNEIGAAAKKLVDAAVVMLVTTSAIASTS